MRTALRVAAGLLLVSGLGTAQPFSGDFYIAGMWYLRGDVVAKIDRNTLSVSTFLATRSTASSRSMNVEIMLAEDNNDFYVLHDDQTNEFVFRVDPTGRIVKTVYDDTVPNNWLTPYDMMLDQNGDILVGERSKGLFKIDRNTGSITSFAAGPATLFNAVTVDIDTGNYLIAGFSSTPGSSARIWSYDFVNGAYVTLWATPGSGSFRYAIDQDITTGIAYAGSCCGTRATGYTLYAYDVRGKSGTLLIGHSVLRAVYAHRLDRRVTGPGNNLIHASVSGFSTGDASGLYTITQQGVITSVKSYGPSQIGVLTSYGMEIGGSRNLASVRTAAPNNRDIRVSFPGPAFANKTYVAALGITGVSPGVPLADGRMINLTPDTVTALSLRNLLPGLWNPGAGRLDAFGRATLKLDLNALGTGVKGLPVWVTLAVLDPRAPSGFLALAETIVIKME